MSEYYNPKIAPISIDQIKEDEIKEYLKSFINDRKPDERYASFDYCFNYFQEFKNKKDIASLSNIQNSCLQLGFYLASWGMYRGSTFILQKSIKFLEPVIEYIASDECDVWDIDVEKYDETNIVKLLKCADTVRVKLGKHIKNSKNKEPIIQEASDTLVTKIMLGVFGNIPAFDAYFKIGSNLKDFNDNALREISLFYKKNHGYITKKAFETKTFNFSDTSDSGINKRSYTKAKIIDMIFFAKGLEESRNKLLD